MNREHAELPARDQAAASTWLYTKPGRHARSAAAAPRCPHLPGLSPARGAGGSSLAACLGRATLAAGAGDAEPSGGSQPGADSGRNSALTSGPPGCILQIPAGLRGRARSCGSMCSCGNAAPVSAAAPALAPGAADGAEERFILGSSWLTQETLFIIFLASGVLLQRIMA